MSVFGANVLPEVPFGHVPLWRQILRGYSQCAFQANEITGLFLIAAAAAFNVQQAAYFVVGVILGTLTARVLKGIPDLLDLGLYGFNSGLMGLALGTFFEPGATLWLAVVVMTIIVGAVAVALSKILPMPMLAAPFILSFWALWAVSEQVGLVKLQFAPFSDTDVLWFQSVLVALGGALFSGAVFTGALFLIGVAVSNWRHAVLASAAVVIAHWIAFEGQAAPGAINAGLIGYNAVLCTLGVYSMLGEDLRLALLAAIGATILIRVFTIITDTPSLAAGFVTMFWLIMLLGWLTPKFKAKEAAAEPEPAAPQAPAAPA
jgi:urea transporter